MNPSMVGDTWTGAIEPESSGQHSCAYERVQTCLEAPELDRADVLFNMGWFVEADHRDGETSLAHYLEAAELALTLPLVANANYRARLPAFDAGNLPLVIALLKKARTIVASQPDLQELDNHAAYWLGIGFEAHGRILDAAEPGLRAEARHRQMLGLASIGAFEAVLKVARDYIEPDDGGDERIAQFPDLALWERNQVRLALGNA
jgi:hypothetical protein